MGRRACAGVGQTLGQGVQLVAAVEAPGEAGQVALGVLGADVMVGAGERGLDVAQGRVDPGERHPAGRLGAAAGDHGEVAAAGLLDRRPAGQAISHHVAAGGEVALGQLLDLLLIQEHFELERFISAAVSSSQHGYLKPHPSIFQAALHLLGVPAGEAVMVGDSLGQDIEGAKEGAGMRAVLVRRGADREPFSRDVDAEVPVIHSLRQLLPLLDTPGNRP